MKNYIIAIVSLWFLVGLISYFMLQFEVKWKGLKLGKKDSLLLMLFMLLFGYASFMMVCLHPVEKYLKNK